MKIVNRETFLAMPNGTVFAKYQPCVFEDLCIKEDSLIADFIYQDIVTAIDCHDSGEFGEKLQDSEENGTSIAMDFNSCGRDGCFDKDQLFAVWEPQDVKALISRLQQALEDSGNGG